MYNEEENVDALVYEVRDALQGHLEHEIVVVDDGSTDETYNKLKSLEQEIPQLVTVRHHKNSGQSAALVTGIRTSRAQWIATLDGDGQNDPGDIPNLVKHSHQHASTTDYLLIAGMRAKRNDTWVRRMSSRIANAVRGSMLKDDCPDTGCGLKVFARDSFLNLPQFDHMHRFMPALFKRGGGKVINVPVNHRPRLRGKSKYGIHNRLWVGIIDLIGVMWLIRRPLRQELENDSD
jgi:dolichol-phosphate mannosyltransferase